MQYRLSSLLIALAVLPPLLTGVWFSWSNIVAIALIVLLTSIVEVIVVKRKEWTR